MVETKIGISFPGEDAVLSWLKPEYQEVIALAQAESHRLGHHVVGTEHLLLGLIKEEKGIAAQALKSVGVTLENALAEVEKIRSLNAQSSEFESSFTPNAKQVIEKTLVFYRDISKSLDNVIGSESLLLAIIGTQVFPREEFAQRTTYAAVQVLQNLGINLSKLASKVMQFYMIQPPSDDR